MRAPSCFRPCVGDSGARRAEEDWEIASAARDSGASEHEIRDHAETAGEPVHRDRPLRRNSHLFKDKHVLTRSAAKDRLQKIISVKKAQANSDDKQDIEFLVLAKIYSEIDASSELARAAKSRDSLSHLLPFLLNALLYGFRDYECPGSSSSNTSVGTRYSKKNSALKVRSSQDPMELSLNGTSHLVKAQCEKQLESFLHENAMRSVYFALDCAWYLTTSLFLGPQAAYHRTMTLLLGLESVVTSYTFPGDLFRKADMRGGDLGVPESLPVTSHALNGLPEPAAPTIVRVPSNIHHGPQSSPAATGGGEIVTAGPGMREVVLDTTGDGERDLKIAFANMKGSDEAKVRQWLDARKERSNLFHAELDFIKCLTDISQGLFGIERQHRRDVLRRELEKLNSFIPKNVYIPTEKRQHRVLRIVPEAAHVFSTKERVPYLLVVEVEDLDPSPLAGQDNREGAANTSRDDIGRLGTPRKVALQGLQPASGPHSATVSNPGISSTSATLSASDAGGNTSSHVREDTIPSDHHAPNQPEDKFEFLPEMTTDASISMERCDIPGAGTGAGSGVLVKRDSSFRVDTEFVDDRRPPDEDLIKALGEPWAEKCERLRSASPFGSNPNWRVISCIVKARDQLRQEMFAQRLIQEFFHIFQNARLPLWLNTYSIVATSSEAGLIETIVDAKSIDSIKKDTPNIVTLQDYFIGRFGGRGSQGYKRAVKNFVQSMAAYSVVSYLLNFKDRHNGNLMIDAEGHVVHIDFGFFLSNSPGGNMEFERSPFKLTNEMAQVMGGPKSHAWKLFRKLSIQGYVEACNHANKIMLMIDIVYAGNEKMPCFLQGRDYVLSNLRERFGVDLSRKERAARMARLIDTAHGNWTTKAYDQFQRLSLGIAK